MTNDIIIISGPTGIGKSKLAIDLAKELNTEIISADSMQIYRGMDIGTAKITPSEMLGIKHHLIDIIDADENYSVQNFQNDAYKIIEDLVSRSKIPIIVGGTGLYIDSLIFDYDFTNVKPDYELRKKLEADFAANPKASLEKLIEIDDRYSFLGIKDKKKIIRALEVYLLSGKKINYERKLSQHEKYNYHLYVLTKDRQKLYEDIDRRVDKMLVGGLVEEVKSLLVKGIKADCQSMKAIGYREVIPFINGEIDYEEMLLMLKQDSRRYAKRQLTWFRRNPKSLWIDKDKYSDENIIENILKDIK